MLCKTILLKPLVITAAMFAVLTLSDGGFQSLCFDCNRTKKRMARELGNFTHYLFLFQCLAQYFVQCFALLTITGRKF